MSEQLSADLLIEPRWLLPMTPAAPALEGHALVVDAGRIVALGPAAELRARFAVREQVRREHHALLPGLVNAYTRASETLLRAVVAPGAESALRASLRASGADADFVRDGTRLAMAEMLCAGITCFADLSAHPEEAARVVAAAQLRAAIGLPVTEEPGAGAEHATAPLARAERLWDQYRSDSRISLYFAPLAVPTLSDATLTRVRRVTDELEARVCVHLGIAGEAGTPPHEVRDAAAPVRAAAAIAVLARLEALGLLRPGFAAVGVLASEREAVALIARHGASLIACPQVSLRAGGAALVRLEGQRTALGTDSPAAVGALDLLAEARVAALLSGLPAAETLRLATLGGATVLGLQAQIGSLEVGKAADLVCIDLDPLACRCSGGVEAAILFGATRSDVSDVWSGGRAAVREHRLLAFDTEELKQLPASWARRLKLGAAA
jgi:5-methylthioadenosine/S-adenosylhomocysteine deaminase